MELLWATLRIGVRIKRGHAMDLKPRLQGQLKLIRQISGSLLSVFKTPEQWTYQVHNQANHAL